MVDVVVFLPIAFMSGIVGAYLREYGAVVVTATLFSLFVSFTLTPLLAAKWSVVNRSEATAALAGGTRRPPRRLRFACARWDRVCDRHVDRLVLAQCDSRVHRRAAAAQCVRAPVRAHSRAVSHDVLALRLAPRSVRGLRLLRAAAQLAFVAAGGGMAIVVVDVLLLAVCTAGHVIGKVLRSRRGSRIGRHAALRQLLPLPRHESRDDHRDVRDAGHTRVADAALGAVSFDFMPAQQTGEIDMTVTYPTGTPIAVTNRYVTRLEMAHLEDQRDQIGQRNGGKQTGRLEQRQRRQLRAAQCSDGRQPHQAD